MLQMHLLGDHSKALAASQMGINPLNLPTAENHMETSLRDQASLTSLRAFCILFSFIIYKFGSNGINVHMNIWLSFFFFCPFVERKLCRKQICSSILLGWLAAAPSPHSHCSVWEVTGMWPTAMAHLSWGVSRMLGMIFCLLATFRLLNVSVKWVWMSITSAEWGHFTPTWCRCKEPCKVQSREHSTPLTQSC